MDGNTRITNGKDGLIVVEVDDSSPEFAAKMVNGYISELNKLLSRLNVTEAQQRRSFYERQLDAVKSKLTQAQQALQQAGVTESTLKVEPKMAAEAYASLQARVTAAAAALDAISSYATRDSAEYKVASANLDSLRRQLSLLERQGSDKKPEAYIAKYREYKYQETLYEMYVRQFELARLDEAKEGVGVQVVDEAVAPERRSKPKRLLTGAIVWLATIFLVFFSVLAHQSWVELRKKY